VRPAEARAGWWASAASSAAGSPDPQIHERRHVVAVRDETTVYIAAISEWLLYQC